MFAFTLVQANPVSSGSMDNVDLSPITPAATTLTPCLAKKSSCW